MELPKLQNHCSERIYTFKPYKTTCIKSRSDKKPKARSGHRIVTDNEGNIYSFGGYSPEVHMPAEDRGDFILMHDCLLFKELWKFNFASKTWMKLRTRGIMPEELASHAVIMVDNYLLVFGGTGVPFGESSSNSVNICDLSNLTWTEVVVSGEPPVRQYGQAVALHENSLYVVGGTTGYDYSMDVHCLNLDTLLWSEIDTMSQPLPRYRHEITVEGDQLLVFGGGTASLSYTLKELPAFDLKTKTWAIVNTQAKLPEARRCHRCIALTNSNANVLGVSMRCRTCANIKVEYPESRRCHGCVRLGDDVYISGGRNSEEEILEDIWAINVKTLTWRKLPCKLPLPVCFHSSAISKEGQMFIFGGVTSVAENQRTNKLYSVWVKIPSLTEMCWQALIYYVPQIARINKQELLSIGVPSQLINRVNFEE